MNRLYLVRHGENLANITLEFSHRRVDYSLTAKGVLQAQQTAAYLSARGIDEIYSSPLRRAIETAEIIAAPPGLPVTVMENFREIDVGELEGQTPTAALWAFHNQILDRWAAGETNLCFPGGEDCLTLRTRAQVGLEEILRGKDGRAIVVVAHGGIFNYGLLRQMQLTEEQRAALDGPMHNCSVTELDARLENGRLEMALRSLPSSAHLSGEAARLVSGVLLPNKGDPGTGKGYE